MSEIAIGIDVGGTGTKGALVRSTGEVLERIERPTEPQAATKSVIAVAEALAGRAAELDEVPRAVGVGAAGFVEHSTGSVTFSPNLIYDDRHLATAVGIRLGLPVTVENDANAAAWGETMFGAAQGCDHVVVVTLGTGIGSGFVIDGRLLRGKTGAGAELGHMVIDPAGPPCPCGLRGCFEQLASGSAITRMARSAAQNDPDSLMIELAGAADQIDGTHVAAAAAQHDETAMRVLRSAGRSLAIGLSNVVNLFDPEVIVLGGGAVEAGEPYLGVARDELAKMTTAQRRRPVRVDLAALGNDAGIVGAAALALMELSERENR
ncbi:MAG: ROK family protein [Actinomycetota bacterium]